MEKPPLFPPQTAKAEIELGRILQPKFAADGTIPCITVDHATNEVLMFAFMNAESLSKTIETRKATYWSRSRKKLWLKGEESGNVLRVVDLFVDCDQDVILLKVENAGPGACHNGYHSCFYRKLVPGADPDGALMANLEFTQERAFDPAEVYRKK
jgi:phosphoribosyl-AMP cyclohydrolase